MIGRKKERRRKKGKERQRKEGRQTDDRYTLDRQDFLKTENFRIFLPSSYRFLARPIN